MAPEDREPRRSCSSDCIGRVLVFFKISDIPAAAESKSSSAVAYCRQLNCTTELQWFVILQVEIKTVESNAILMLLLHI